MPSLSLSSSSFGSFKKLRRLLQSKCHRTKPCVMLRILRLFHVGYVVQSRGTILSLSWHEWVFILRQRMKDFRLWDSVIIRTSNMKISCRHLADCVKKLHQKRAARAARLFFLIQPIKSLVCDVVVAVPVVIS